MQRREPSPSSLLAAILLRVPHQEVFARGVATRNLVDSRGFMGWSERVSTFVTRLYDRRT